MNEALAEQVARAVLYEGYILYPYRPSSVKNQQRWNFGGVYPRAYSEAQAGADAWQMQTECLVAGSPNATLEIKVRFLQLVARTVGVLAEPETQAPIDGEPAYQTVDSLRVGGRVYRPWQEATEREVAGPRARLSELLAQPYQREIRFPAGRTLEPLREPSGSLAGVLVREHKTLKGVLDVTARRLDDHLYKVTVHIFNVATCEAAGPLTREAVLPLSFVSTHALLGVRGGEFVSLLDPPAELGAHAAGCRNLGAWPVLLGEAGAHDLMLASPIILYDYPQIAPESAGDLFDGTEIDEILTLRILTLTDDEKQEIRESDERGRELLERTECMPPEVFMRLHGVVRGMRPVEDER